MKTRTSKTCRTTFWRHHDEIVGRKHTWIIESKNQKNSNHMEVIKNEKHTKNKRRCVRAESTN